MLMALRDKLTGWLAWFVVALIALAFGAWGVSSYLNDQAPAYAARVNDVEIGARELDRALQRERQRVRQEQGDAFDPSQIEDSILRPRLVEDLVQRAVLAQAAVKQRFVISDAALRARIQAEPAFQFDGDFSAERYETLLASRDQTTVGFEESLRESLAIDQMVNGIAAWQLVPAGLVEKISALELQQRRLRYATLRVKAFEDKVVVEAEDIRARYEEGGERYFSPEQVKLEYLELDLSDMSKDVVVSEKELLRFFEDQSDKYGVPEERQVRHILVTVADDADEGTIDEARVRAAALRERVEKGEDFAELASQASDDPGSRSQGGDLGFISRGLMVPEFEEAMFALAEGELGGPVRTGYGFHLIEVLKINPATTRPLSEVRGELEEKLRREQVLDRFFDESEHLATLVFEHPDSLDLAAAELGLEPQVSGWISRDGGAGIGGSPAVIRAAFAAEVLEDGYNSAPLEVDEGRMVVVRVGERRAAQQRPFDEVRAEIESELRRELASGLVSQAAAQVLEAAQQGGDLEQLADEQGVTVEDAGLVQRNSLVHPPAVVDAAFSIARPQDEGSRYLQVVLPTGDRVIVAVDEVRDMEAAEMSTADRERGKRMLTRAWADLNARLLDKQLRQEADIEIPQRAE